MKLSKETIEIIKNFSIINNSLLLKKGKIQRTISPQKTILAQATISEDMPIDCAIYNLSQWLGVLALQGDADIAFGEKSMAIKNGASIVTYFYSSPENIMSPPDKKITLAAPDVTAAFTLKSEDLQQAIKAAAVLGLPEIVLFGRDGQAFIGACDVRSKTANGFELKIGRAESNYRMLFRVENIKVLPRAYSMQLSSRLAYFQSEAKDLEYWAPIEVVTASAVGEKTSKAA